MEIFRIDFQGEPRVLEISLEVPAAINMKPLKK